MENNKNLLAFRGGEDGFVGNHYAIWQSGLSGDASNLWAVRAGVRTSVAALKNHSTHGNAIYKQLIDFLWKIQRQEETKEKDWISKKEAQLSQFGIESQYQQAIQGAINRKEFGLAYTLMTQANQDLKELTRELGKNGQSMARLNKFWKAQFERYFVKKLDKAFQQKELGDLNVNLSIDQILNEWIDELIQGSEVSMDSIRYIRDTMEDGLLTLFKNQNIHLSSKDNLLDVDFKQFVSAKRVVKKKNNGGRSETLNGLLHRVETTIGKGLQKGLSAELLAIGESGRAGGTSLGAGNIQKTIANEFTGKFSKVQQKSDVISIEAYNTIIDYSPFVDDFYEQIKEGGQVGLKKLEQKLQQIIKDTDDIYIVEVNTKGYKSLRDLHIEKEGSFNARMNNLYSMKDSFPAKSIDQLIFLLNNTMDDCVASHHKDLLGDYFSAIFAAWMWDDYTEMFKLAQSDGVKRIRIFNSGGMYFSASQMMKITLEDLQNQAGSSSFIYAKIEPPSFNPHEYYDSLKEKYPIEGLPGGQERQNLLAQRWDDMRNKVMKEGQVSIYIRQKQLDELFGKLLSFM